MNAFSRSWAITKLSFGVVNADREMLLFPLLGGLFSALYAVAVMVPTFMLVDWQHGERRAPDAGLYVGLFALYFGLAFLATFFNTCVVYTSKVRFEGGDATFGESLSFAISRLHLIFLWSLLAASVGVLLRLLDRAAERSGQVGHLIIGIMTSMLGLAWSVVTIFVVPAMVFHGLRTIDAIKRSTQVLKRTWGESLIRHYGLGLIQFLVILAGALPLGVLFMLSGGGTPALVILGVGIVYMTLVALVFGLANTVFNTAARAISSVRVPRPGLPTSVASDSCSTRFRQPTTSCAPTATRSVRSRRRSPSCSRPRAFRASRSTASCCRTATRPPPGRRCAVWPRTAAP